MKNLVKTWDSLKFNDPKVFALVSIVANIAVNILIYFATYGKEELRPVFALAVSVITLYLNNIGVRTTSILKAAETNINEINEDNNDSYTN